MKAINIICYLATLYLVSLFVRSVILPKVRQWLYNYKEKQLLKKGNKKFYFEKNKVIVFAHTQEQANAKYKKMKSNLKKKHHAILEQNRKQA